MNPMNPYEQYLLSAQAAQDVAKQLTVAGLRRGTFIQKLGLLCCDEDGRWVKTQLLDNGREKGRGWVPVFSRMEDRCLVTDLGAATAALQHRAGYLLTEKRDFLHDAAADALEGIPVDEAGLRGDAIYAAVAPDVLPRAIVRIMLAAWRVANMETPW